MRPSVDIITVNHNTADDLAACLRSIFAAPPAGLARVWVVDNASTDGSPARVAREFPSVTLLALPSNVGFAAANNQAIRESTATLVLLLNSDTIVPPGAIDVLIDRLEATGAVAAGAKLIDDRGRPEISFGAMLSPLAEWRQRRLVRLAASERAAHQEAVARHVAAEQWVDWVSGACLLVRRAEAVSAGLFDERFFLYEEDVDFCAALRARGGRILFAPAAEVRHRRGRSVAAAGAMRSPHYDRSHLEFYRKHRPGWARILALWLRARGRTVR